MSQTSFASVEAAGRVAEVRELSTKDKSRIWKVEVKVAYEGGLLETSWPVDKPRPRMDQRIRVSCSFLHDPKMGTSIVPKRAYLISEEGKQISADFITGDAASAPAGVKAA